MANLKSRPALTEVELLIMSPELPPNLLYYGDNLDILKLGAAAPGNR